MATNDTVSHTKYVTYAQHVAQLGFISTTFTCLILIYLTVFEVKRNFGSYKYFLVSFPVFGMIFATSEVVLYLNVFSHNAGYLYYSTSHPFNLGTFWVDWLLVFYAGVYALTISMIAIQFVYRYWAIFSDKKLSLFKGWKFLFSLFYSLFFGLFWSIGMFYFCKIDEYSRSYFAKDLLLKYKIDISEIAGMALVAYNADGSIRWRNSSCTLNMTLIMLIQYSIIIYCAVRMYHDMESKLQLLSASLRNLHKQFFKTLILQIVTPTIILFSPVMFIIYLPFFDLEVDLPTGIFLCALTTYPALDACIVMYVVQDYRNAAKHMLIRELDRVRTWLISSREAHDAPTQTGMTD
ncbi:unnamed protein product [Caenorhabditis nigoni]